MWNLVVMFFRKAFLRQLRPENCRILNDIDNSEEYNIHRAMAFYTYQTAAQQSDFAAEIDPTQMIVLRF